MLDENWKQNLKNIKNAKNYLGDYKYSSYHDLISKLERKENKILTVNQKVLEISKIANTLDKLFSSIPPSPGR